MELETMFTEQKWNILKTLSGEKNSPLQLADKLNTTIANISQQLRLLEAAGLVKKEKIRNRDKGKPRTLFSLSDDYAYLIPTAKNFAEKKLIKVSVFHKIILKIWFLENAEIHPHLERLFWKIEPHFDKIQAIYFKQATNQVLIIEDSTGDIAKLALKSKHVEVKVFTKDEAEKAIKSSKEPFHPLDALSVLYDREKNGK